MEEETSIASDCIDPDTDFNNRKEEAKKDLNLACDLYRSYVGSAETREERLRRIQMFRCG